MYSSFLQTLTRYGVAAQDAAEPRLGRLDELGESSLRVNFFVELEDFEDPPDSEGGNRVTLEGELGAELPGGGAADAASARPTTQNPSAEPNALAKAGSGQAPAPTHGSA